jgi:predicted DsbA family dithiol-disulfide isomerase
MSAEICVRIDEFTDPLCPWAWSAEPFRRRLQWLYEGRIEWVPRMVVLADTPADQVEKGFTPEKFASNLRTIAHEHRMPIDTRERDYVPASAPACLAVVAARLHADPTATRKLLRALRVRTFSGQQTDEQATIDGAAADAGIDPAELASWAASPEAAAELERDRADARRPSPAANVLDHKLANWSGGRRYTCPSYEITRLADDVTIAVPGFQPFAVYDTILANLVPGMERREPAETAAEVLEWTRVPLATQEVAVLCDSDFDDAREELGRIATQRPVGADGFWSLNGAQAARAV